MKNKILSLLALLMAATTGAWAQEPEYIDLTTTDYKTWTLDAMPAYAVGLIVEYETELELADAGNNTTKVGEWDGCEANVTLTSRTLYKDGDWNTLCLPFDVDLTADGCPLNATGVEARTLTAASISGGTLNMTFGDPVTTLAAGVPYIIKWTKDDVNPTIEAPVFNGVEVDATDNSFDNGVTGDKRVRFIGTYKNIAFTDENKDGVLVLGSNNTLHYVTTGAGQGAQRAYFLIGDKTALAPQLTSFNISFSDETTGIRLIDNGQLTIDNSVYDLQGRKVAQPTKGLYIVNGKKVVIK
jgi:hypothetical protein